MIAGTRLRNGGPERPQMGYVSGTVKLGGEPLAGAIVVMKPDSGRMATAITDSKGYYDIEYTKGEKGTKIGPTTVSFEWPLGAQATKPIPGVGEGAWQYRGLLFGAGTALGYSEKSDAAPAQGAKGGSMNVWRIGYDGINATINGVHSGRRGFSSNHVGGCHFTLADGSVRFMLALGFGETLRACRPRFARSAGPRSLHPRLLKRRVLHAFAPLHEVAVNEEQE